jgi:hypothetical protein
MQGVKDVVSKIDILKVRTKGHWRTIEIFLHPSYDFYCLDYNWELKLNSPWVLTMLSSYRRTGFLLNTNNSNF